jgi:RNA polymerase sigma-54 factor
VKLGLNQNLRTELGLRLSPQILQRIEVLQLPALDLAEMIEQELQENDALEVDTELEDAPAEQADDDGLDLPDMVADDDWRPARPDGEGSSSTDVLQATASAPVTLHDHLTGQLDLMDLESREREIAALLIESLDERGWLGAELDEIDLDVRPPAGLDEREHALHIVQRLEPLGVGCRDMVECLLLQLDPDAEGYQLLATLLLGHLDDIAHNRIPRIVRETGHDVSEVLTAIDAISHLDPLPGRSFGRSEVPHVRPDVSVYRVGDDFEISLENDWIPNLLVSRSYLDMSRDRSTDAALRKHIRGRIESARSLIDAVAQRKHTLFRVASELVNRQANFIEQGKSRLRPLRMQEVADALGVHVSTVSRAISGKYLQTPHGIMPMKDLFTGEVPTRGGSSANKSESESRASVQERIREIIDVEDKLHPLSDEAIVSILSERHSLAIARRTVTKYRKAMKLGSSRARRVYRPS